MDNKAMVEVFNNSTGRVFYNSNMNNVKRLWELPNASRQISIEELKELLFTEGGYQLLTEDLLIKDIEVRQFLELPIDPALLLDEKGIKDLLKKSVSQLRDMLGKTNDTIKERIASVAVESKLTDTDKLDAIQEATGIDVLALIKEKKEEEKLAKDATKNKADKQ